jgi:WD40 repeat protein
MRCRSLLYALSLLVLTVLAGPIAQAQVARVYPRIETGQHTGRITRLAVDAAERWVVTASEDKTARVWNLKTGHLERILRPPVGEGDEGQLYAMALSPDGVRIAVGGFTGPDGSGSYSIYLFDRATGRLAGRSHGFSNRANSMAFSRDGARLATVFKAGAGMHILDASDLTRELAGNDDCKEDAYGVDFDRAGRLVTSCWDGVVRLYDPQGKRIAMSKAEGGAQPFGVRFSPDGSRIAVGFHDTAHVTVLSGRDLTALYDADTSFAQDGDLGSVTWSQDGAHLYAGGTFGPRGHTPIVAWSQQGRGAPVLFDVALDSVMNMAPLSHGRLLFASADASWGILGSEGQHEQTVLAALLDFAYYEDEPNFRLSHEGTRIEFGSHIWDGHQSTHAIDSFDLDTRTLTTEISAAAGLSPPRTEGLPLTFWRESTAPELAGQPLTGLDKYETVYALSIAAGGGGFVLGTNWWLRSFDAGGRQRWRQSIPGAAWRLNQSDDGRFAVAALADGTIRWYDATTGRERLALFVHARDHRWVLFTPEGFYQASPGGDALIGYQLNQGPDHEGQFVDSAQLASVFFRPDLITARLAGDEAAITAAVAKIGDVRTVLAGDLPPAVELLSPSVAESDSGDYELKVRITPSLPGARVGEIQLTINGAAIQSRELSPSGGGEVTRHISLAPGVNTVSVRVLRADGKVASSEVVTKVTVHPPQIRPVLRVLAVGISQYDDRTLRVGVKFAARDATDVVQQLKSGAGGMYREVDDRVLTSRADTSLSRIETELQSLTTRARPEDVVVIYLAGHGRASDGEYHFIPADFVYDSDKPYGPGRTLSYAVLESRLQELGAGKRLLILDTCDSGSALRDPVKDAVARLMRSTGRYILAAAAAEGSAQEAGGHGIYTYALLEGLSGKADPAHTGVIEVDALASYVSTRVRELTQNQQIPMRSSSGENFPIASHH